MRALAVLLLAAVELGGAFGLASATVDSIDETSMVIELSVEVRVTAQAVVAHLSFGDDNPTPMSLLSRGGDVFGIRTELEPKNYVVVFEAVGEEAALSDPRTLTQLGADLSSGDPIEPGSEEALTSATQQFGWLALALGAASLSALAFWVLGGRDGRKEGMGFTDEEE